jgi:hypothetical protein
MLGWGIADCFWCYSRILFNYMSACFFQIRCSWVSISWSLISKSWLRDKISFCFSCYQIILFSCKLFSKLILCSWNQFSLSLWMILGTSILMNAVISAYIICGRFCCFQSSMMSAYLWGSILDNYIWFVLSF